MSQRVAELDSADGYPAGHAPAGFDRDGEKDTVILQLKKEIESKNQLVAERENKIKKISVKLKQLFDSLGAFKRREKELQVIF